MRMDFPAPGRLSLRHADAEFAGEIAAGERILRFADFRGSATGDEVAAETACAGAEIDHVVGALDGIGIMLDDKDRVAHVMKFGECVEQADRYRADEGR